MLTFNRHAYGIREIAPILERKNILTKKDYVIGGNYSCVLEMDCSVAILIPDCYRKPTAKIALLEAYLKEKLGHDEKDNTLVLDYHNDQNTSQFVEIGLSYTLRNGRPLFCADLVDGIVSILEG